MQNSFVVAEMQPWVSGHVGSCRFLKSLLTACGCIHVHICCCIWLQVCSSASTGRCSPIVNTCLQQFSIVSVAAVAVHRWVAGIVHHGVVLQYVSKVLSTTVHWLLRGIVLSMLPIVLPLQFLPQSVCGRPNTPRQQFYVYVRTVAPMPFHHIKCSFFCGRSRSIPNSVWMRMCELWPLWQLIPLSLPAVFFRDYWFM